MTTFVRELIAVPLRIIIWLCSMIPIFDSLVLAKILFKLTNNIDDAISYLELCVTNNSLESAREIGDKLLCETKNSRVAMIMSLAENNAENFSESRQWILRAKQENCLDQDFLLLPELTLSIAEQNIDYKIVDEIISRNNLPMQFSTLAYWLKCEQLIFSEELEEANTIATKVLDIQDYYTAFFIRWIYEAKKGNASQAALLLKQAIASAKKRGLRDDIITLLIVQGFVFLEDFSSACDYLREIDAANIKQVLTLAKRTPKMVSFLKTQDFRNFHNHMKGQK